jgi:hypothetical protein
VPSRPSIVSLTHMCIPPKRCGFRWGENEEEEVVVVVVVVIVVARNHGSGLGPCSTMDHEVGPRGLNDHALKSEILKGENNYNQV